MKKTVTLSFLVAIISSCWVSGELPPTEIGRQEAMKYLLCDALEKVKPSERIQVTLSGIYEVGHEIAMFYDHHQPQCDLDVQPVTWVEMAPSVQTESAENYHGLRRILEESSRACVTFKGELQGPGKVGADDLPLPKMISYANRTRGLRYGHLNSFRTKLVVQSILQVEPVFDSSPTGGQWHKKADSSSALPVPINATLPYYPPMPRSVGIEGEVVIETRVASGKVVKATVLSGDRMLRQATLESIESWRFDPEVKSRFMTTFIYKLELRSTGSSQEPRIILELPEKVTVIGAANGW